MRFGGHQTFFIREGWLYKGLSLLRKNPELIDDKYAADYLGVGRNMAQSIIHWMQASGLAERQLLEGKKRTGVLKPTKFADLVWKYDKYFVDEGTWWLIHINLVFATDFAATWNWFFNQFQHDRFDRGECLEAIIQWQAMESGRQQSPHTLERDIAVLLLSYATHIPPLEKDPEEEIDCPLRDLGLLNNYRQSGFFQARRQKRNIPTSILMYALNRSWLSEVVEGSMLEKKLIDVIRAPNSPTRLFFISNDDFYESLAEIQYSYGNSVVELRGLAGERMVRMVLYSDYLEWMRRYYVERNVS